VFTAVSAGTSPSFQDQVIAEAKSSPGAFFVGMNSTSFPVGGTVLSTGYKFKHSERDDVTLEQYKDRRRTSVPSPLSSAVSSPAAQTGVMATKTRKKRKVRVITYIPTLEEAKQGKREEYHYEYR